MAFIISLYENISSFVKLYYAQLGAIVLFSLTLLGSILGLLQLREYYKLRIVQICSSFNDRLSKCGKAIKWANGEDVNWFKAPEDAQYEFQNMIAVFEDIGLARKKKIISRKDFIVSYGGRFSKIIKSGALDRFMKGAGYDPVHFVRLDILKKDLKLFEREPMSRFIEFILEDSENKISINPSSVAAIEQNGSGSKVFLDSGKEYKLKAEYETAAAMLIHESDSEKRANRNLISNLKVPNKKLEP